MISEIKKEVAAMKKAKKLGAKLALSTELLTEKERTELAWLRDNGEDLELFALGALRRALEEKRRAMSSAVVRPVKMKPAAAKEWAPRIFEALGKCGEGGYLALHLEWNRIDASPTYPGALSKVLVLKAGEEWKDAAGKLSEASVLACLLGRSKP